jgi:hypothetical protein
MYPLNPHRPSGRERRIREAGHQRAVTTNLSGNSWDYGYDHTGQLAVVWATNPEPVGTGTLVGGESRGYACGRRCLSRRR